ncbi:Undecaprenyl-phosphate 4-deoxy-4-formamido-L-arabinose transferase [Afipia felis]
MTQLSLYHRDRHRGPYEADDRDRVPAPGLSAERTASQETGECGLDRILKVGARPLLRSGATVSVVIPNYNYARYLPDAVHSALSQPNVSVEIIIVDDASTDNSVEVARKLAGGDERIRILVHGENTGPVETFNDGLAEARGEFLVRLDADDILTPGSLERSVAVAQHFPTVGIVYGHPLHFSGTVRRAARTKPTTWTIWPGRTWLADRCCDGSNVITSPEVLMRKSLVDIVGGQQQLAHTHDMEMWLRLSAFADVAYIHGVDQAWHREHADSLSARKVDRIRDMSERRDAFITLFEGKAGKLMEADKLHRSAMRAIASHALEEALYAYIRGPQNRDLIDRYLLLAKSAVGDVDTLPEWHAVHKWMERHPRSVALHPVFVVRRAYRRLRHILSWRRWHRSGVY